MLKYYGNKGWYQLLVGQDCEGSSFSDSRATGTVGDRPKSCLQSRMLRLPFSSSSFCREYHPLPSTSSFSSFPRHSFYSSTTFAVFFILWHFFFISFSGFSSLTLYNWNIQNGLKCVKRTWNFSTRFCKKSCWSPSDYVKKWVKFAFIIDSHKPSFLAC